MDDLVELLKQGFILYQKNGKIGVEDSPDFWECDLAFSRWEIFPSGTN